MSTWRRDGPPRSRPLREASWLHWLGLDTCGIYAAVLRACPLTSRRRSPQQRENCLQSSADGVSQHRLAAVPLRAWRIPCRFFREEEMIRNFVIAAVLVGSNLAGIGIEPSFAQTSSTHRHGFGGAEHWARVFDDPARDEWQKPHQVIHALNLAPSSIVADIGSGTGYFSIRLAHFVPKGRVFGVDTEPDMVKYLADRAKRDGLSNVTAVTGMPDDAHLPAKVDLVLMVDVYHHVAGREQYFRRLQNSLKPGGRVAIIDYKKDSPMGPPANERIAADGVKAELRAAGYALVKEHDFLPHQYFLIFRVAKP